jgi:hypothetical protein
VCRLRVLAAWWLRSRLDKATALAFLFLLALELRKPLFLGSTQTLTLLVQQHILQVND